MLTAIHESRVPASRRGVLRPTVRWGSRFAAALAIAGMLLLLDDLPHEALTGQLGGFLSARSIDRIGVTSLVWLIAFGDAT